jgi:hypothetical protein
MDDFDPVTYEAVNAAWHIALPPITAKQSAVVYRKLLAKFGGRMMKPPLYYFRTSRSWADPKGRPAGGPGYGLPRVVHDASHWVHLRLHPKAKSHCAPHAALEKAMVEHVIAKGWHIPPAPKAKAKPSREQRLAHARAALARWTTKKRRAETAIKKLTAKARRLEREAISTPPATP